MNLEVGDTVRFTSQWLKNTGQIVGTVPFLRGEIILLQHLSGGVSVATVEFNRLSAHGPNATIDPPEHMKALTSNLELVKKGANE